MLWCCDAQGKTYKQLKYFRAAGPITAVFFSTIFVKLVRPSSISVVGNIPQGLPGLSLDYRFEAASRLLPTAALITGVAILVQFLMCKYVIEVLCNVTFIKNVQCS
jgi:hypothetical protein